ncbi:Flagellar motor protein MotB [Candidatus Magnetomoraceae bacterium gMMP-1]
MAKKKKIQENDGGGGERVLRGLTVSLFILLLAFFIVLNSMAVEDEKRAMEALGSLLGAFSSMMGGASVIKSSGDDPINITSPFTMDASMRTHKIVGLDHNASGKVFIRTTPEGEVISILYEVLFEEGSYLIKPLSYDFLLKICKIINEDTHPVKISGHTDSRPPDEQLVSSNWEFSSLHALEILRFFIEKGGVLPERIRGYGRAEFDPIASNETKQTRAKNRRIDIILDHRVRGKLKQLYQKEPSSLFIFKKFVFDIFSK